MAELSDSVNKLYPCNLCHKLAPGDRRSARHFCSNKHRSLYYFKTQGRAANTSELSMFKRFVSRARMSARVVPRLGPVSITPSSLKSVWEAQHGRCPYTGWSLRISPTTAYLKDIARKSDRASLDRIDSSRPYSIGNVQFVSILFNLTKSNGTDKEAVKVCRAVSACSGTEIGCPRAPAQASCPENSLSRLSRKNFPAKFQPFAYFASKIKRTWPESTLNYDDMVAQWEIQQGVCPFTGWKLVLPWKVGNRALTGNWIKRASLDRIDHLIGYEPGNVRWVAQPVNIGKNTQSDTEFLEFCHAVANHCK